MTNRNEHTLSIPWWVAASILMLVLAMGALIDRYIRADHTPPTPAPGVTAVPATPSTCAPLCSHGRYLTEEEDAENQMWAGIASVEGARDWSQCTMTLGDTTVVTCPDGARYVS